MPHEIQARRCANCHAYEGRQCMNLVTFLGANGQPRQPLPGDVCPEHMTQDEDQTETALIEEGRECDGLKGSYVASQAWRAGRDLIATLTKQAKGGTA